MRVAAIVVAFACACASLPASAARPLLDRHQWDAYFSLFARDVNVPWKPTTVRLDTYSGAPVDFAAYNVDPADVIIAGAARTTRAVDTSHRKPVVRWRFSPPPGYRFETSDVAIPLGASEGFYVIEARRGEAVQQVWINRTHLGLLTQESPEGLVVWCVDLHSGRALANVDVSFLVGLTLVSRRTDRDGLIVWRDRARPTFALAAQGASRAFVSILPQAPLPETIVGLRLDSAVARAGDLIRFVGFARKRTGSSYRRAAGGVVVRLLGRGRTLASQRVKLDAAGAFVGELRVPAGADTNDDAVLASAAGGVGGTSVHVDAQSDVALHVAGDCPCDPARDVPLVLSATRGGVPVAESVRVVVVRAPHVVPPGAADSTPRWGTTVVLDRIVRTGADGTARVVIPSPSDGLDSTYGIRASARGTSASARIVVGDPRLALALEPDAVSADVGAPVGFELRGFDPADGAPQAGVPVTVRLSHGASLQTKIVTLDARGRAHVVFNETSLGANLALAQATVAGRSVFDAAAVEVAPSALSGRVAVSQNVVGFTLDRSRYRPGDALAVRAALPGASGDALVSLEGARTYATRRASVAGGVASATFPLGEAQGDVRVAAAFVRDGAIAVGSAPVAIDGPGHARETEIALEKTAYAPGEAIRAQVRDGGVVSGATLALRIADGRESGPALFDDAPDLMRTGATSAQAPASDDPEWHAYVAPARSKAFDIFAAERPRKAPSEVPSLGVAAPKTFTWRVERAVGDSFEITAPHEPGHYVLSLLKISDDGDVGAAAASFDVR